MESLEGQVYSIEKTNECLANILRTGYFVEGHVETKRDHTGAVEIQFFLHAPKLKVTQLDFDVRDDFRRALMEWLDKDPERLRLGSIDSSHAEAPTENGIKAFFLANGYRAVISLRRELNYDTGTAKLTYKIFTGAPAPKEAVLPPYREDCDDVVHGLNLTDVDDFVPLTLVKRLLQINAASCFDDQLANADREALEKTGLFKQVDYLVEGEHGSRSISLAIKGKPLRVASISVDKFGNPVDISSLDTKDLPIHPGEIFHETSMGTCMDYIAKRLGDAGQLANIYHDVRVVNKDQVLVQFDILGFVPAELYVNGKQVPSADVSFTAQFTP